MAEMADADRLRGLPIHIVHGRLDWMFPVQVARQTSQALSAAGANVTYREIEDLSHCYPREINAELLQWLNGLRDSCLTQSRRNLFPRLETLSKQRGGVDQSGSLNRDRILHALEHRPCRSGGLCARVQFVCCSRTASRALKSR